MYIDGLDLPFFNIPSNPTNYGGYRALSSIEYIVTHFTANNGDTDTGNGSYFSRTAVGAGSHLFVDNDSCTQSIPFDRIAYHCETKGMPLKCGCHNANSIGVEMCSVKINGQYAIPKQTMLNTVKVVKYLMQRFNIPAANVIRHYDVCGKICPEPWVRVPSEWQEFKKLIQEVDEMTESQVREIAKKEANDMVYKYRDKVYNKISEVPEWGRSTVEKLYNKGLLKGTDKGLEIGETLLRVLVINDRAGIYN